jgi:hypothetical protein
MFSPDPPTWGGFSLRLLALLAALGLFVLYDLRKPPEKRCRLKESGFLLACAAAGALFGMAADSITSSLSPDYFIHGKGIPSGPRFLASVLCLGAQAGCSAAIIGAGILLLFNADPGNVRRLISLSVLPFSLAALCGILLGVLQHQYQAARLPDVEAALGDTAARRFALVWMAHIGIYAGGFLGLVVGCLQARRRTWL